MAASINSIPTVEFVIIPREDLYLLGPKRMNTLKRIDKGAVRAPNQIITLNLPLLVCYVIML